MAGQFRFKNSSGAIVAQISASNAGAMSFSGSAVDFSSVTSLTLGTSTLTGTASFATAAVSSSYSNIALTGSNAMTASSADTLYVRNNATVLGSITAQTLVVQTVTSSVDYVTGSTRFGSLQANTHIFTGSLSLTGSAAFLGGNVGVGTSSPATALHVDASGGGVVRVTRLGAGSAYTQIEADGSNGTLASSTNLNINAGGSTRLYVSSSGNVGIGTTSPARPLTVASYLDDGAISSGGNLYSNAYFGSGGLMIGTVSSTGNGTIFMNTNRDTIFGNWNGSTNAERMRITSAGYVGIGTTSPSYILHLKAAVGNTTGLRLESNGGTTNFDILSSEGDGNAYLYQRSNYGILIGTNNTERMRITSGGDIQLTGNTYLYAASTAGSTTVSAGFRLEQSTNTLISYTNNTERMRIGSDGTKYLGTYNTSRLQINASGEAIYQYTNNYYIYGFYNDANSLNIESAFAGNIIFRTGAQTTSSSPTTTTERMRITSGGIVTINGTNAAERFRLNNSDSTAWTSFSEQEIRMWRQNDSGAYFSIATQAFSGTWTGGGGAIDFRPLNTLRMTISAAGNIGAPSGTNIYNASDIRLKQNVSTTTYGLDTISLLNPVKYNWVDGFEPSEDGKDLLGFVAQEVLEVIPEAVESFGGDVNLNGDVIDNPLRVNEKFIIPVLVKAVQELSAKNDSLEARLAALENA